MFCFLIDTAYPSGHFSLAVFSPHQKPKILQQENFSGSVSSCFISIAFQNLYQKHKNLLKKQDVFIAVSQGPGRFTGLRVGLSFAKTLNFIKAYPIYPMSSLKIRAEAYFDQEKPVLVLMNGFKNCVFTALYKKQSGKWKTLISPCVLSPKELNQKIKMPCLCIGDGYNICAPDLSLRTKEKITVKQKKISQALDMAMLFKREFLFSKTLSWTKLQPLYLRSPVKAI